MLNAESAVLVIIDVQGKLAQLMADRETLFANLQRMIKGAILFDIPILWAEQNPAKLGPTIPEVAALLSGQEPIGKTSFSCAGNEQFCSALDELGRKQLLLVGIEAHVCVYHTAIDLLAQGFEVEVVEDAIGARIATNKAVAVRKLGSRGVGLTSTEMALFELLGSSEHPRFREVQAVFK